MAKSKKNLDVTIKREVTDTIRVSMSRLFEAEQDVDSAAFALSYLRDNFLSKYVDENTDPAATRRHRAIVKWLGVEQRNERTNRRLYSTDPFFKGLGFGHDVLRKASKLIERTIGRTPPPDLLYGGRFSGGSSTSLRLEVGTFAKKFIGKRDVTPSAWRHIKYVIFQTETWQTLNDKALQPRLVKGNVLFTVPKTSIIDRVACKEPDYNVFGQKAIGDYFRRALRKRGIDLNDQSINRSLAHQGSIDGKLATIDLSSASDSMSISLVSLLLPKDWFNLLDDFRCEKTFINGASHVNAMFSSMGNAFTFELESLIFWALAWSVRDITKAQGRISVYGDDIIVPSQMAGMLIQLLLWVGFTTNVKKTFVRGPFRESCGGHYYRGLDVTPFFLREPVRDQSDLILFLNQLRAWIIRTGFDAPEVNATVPSGFVELWMSLSGLVRSSLKGGYDLESRSRLVSPDRGNCELIATTRRRRDLEKEYGAGLYLSRLVDEDPPSDRELVDSFLLQPTGEFAIRRVKVRNLVFGLAAPLFWSEQQD